MGNLLERLAGGDRRSIGRSDQVVEFVLRNPGAFEQIISGLRSDGVLVRMRCADVAEKVSAIHGDWLQAHKATLLALAAETTQQELRWHLAQMLPRLKLSPGERLVAAESMFNYLEDKSRIVKTFAAQALADFAEHDPELRKRVVPILRNLERTGSPAVRSRARRLNARLQKQAVSAAP